MPTKSCSAALAIGAAALGGANADSSAFATPSLRASAAELRVTHSGEAQADSQSSVSRGAGGAFAVTSLAAAAIAGSVRRGRRSAAKASVVACSATAPKVIAGTGGPFPEDFWDPAGLCKNKTDEEILYYRAAEIKHGRIAMAAVVGWFHVAGGLHYIGDLAARHPTSNDPLKAIQELPIQAPLQIVFAIMILEWLFNVACPPPKEAPWDVLGWRSVLSDPEDPRFKQELNRELNNGRLAMMAIIGLIAQDLWTGEYGAWISNACAILVFSFQGLDSTYGSACPYFLPTDFAGPIVTYPFPDLYPRGPMP